MPNVSAPDLPKVPLLEAARVVVTKHRAAPGAAVAAALDERRGEGAFGTLTYAENRAVTVQTLFDLASVTKPMVALLAARLAMSNVLSLDEPLSAFLPDLRDTASAGTSLLRLMSHRAGLEAHLELYAPLVRGEPIDRDEALRTAANARRADCIGEGPAEGFPPIYSDMGYLLLGEALATRAGGSLDDLLEAQLFEPLGARIGSARQLARREPFHERVAPTEVVDFRGGLVTGLVHDENAFAIVRDASAGHAGLFGDARSVRSIGLEILAGLRGEGALFTREALAPLVETRPGGTLRAGFDGRSGETPASGRKLGARTFGHLGFTGTSMWIDPDRAFVGVLLTNRVHPTRENIAIRAARPDAYDAMVDALEGQNPGA